MKFTDFLSVLSGLAIFLYGMEVMGSGFKHMAGGKLKDTLEKLTKTPLIGLFAGILITVLVQSSGATTSMLVSFVNAGIMKVAQTIYVIMGSNIGTTLTGHLMALDVGLVSPFLAFFGVCFIMFFKKDRINALGEILMGLGFIFIGMDTMSAGLSPLRSSPFFIQLLVSLRNPFLGLLVGFVFTTMVQSSTASLGIIQSLAKGGLVAINDVMFFNLGQKIGSCTTALLASLSFNRDAKRVSIINFAFNILGAVVFGILYMLLPFDKWYAALAPGNVVEQIALMHTIVSVAETVLFYPFGKQLANIAYLIIPDQGTQKSLKTEVIPAAKSESTPGFNIYGINVEVNNMFQMVENSLRRSIVALLEHASVKEEVYENEDKVNAIHKGISNNLSLLMASNINRQEAAQASQLFAINMDLERLSDHACNIAESGEAMVKKDLNFATETYDEIREIARILFESMDRLNDIVDGLSDDFAIVYENEDKLDDLCFRYRDREIERLSHGSGEHAESGIIYTELLIDLERVGDHLINLADQLSISVKNS